MSDTNMNSSTDASVLQRPSRFDRVKRLLTGIRHNRSALIGVGLLTPILLITVFAPYLTTHDPTTIDAAARFQGPSAEHLFGTDLYGRDLFSRVILGGRVSLLISGLAIVLALSIGVPVGLTAGYYRGKVDEVLMRLMDIMLSFPTLIMALLVLTMISSNRWNTIIVVGLVYSPSISRVVRARTLSVRNQDFVLAAKARGESSAYIIGREILPNITSPIIVEASIRLGYAILITSALSFLGFGAQPPIPDWGYMISQARNYIDTSPWFLLWPCLFISTTVVGLNLLGDGLRDIVGVRELDE